MRRKGPCYSFRGVGAQNNAAFTMALNRWFPSKLLFIYIYIHCINASLVRVWVYICALSTVHTTIFSWPPHSACLCQAMYIYKYLCGGRRISLVVCGVSQTTDFCWLFSMRATLNWNMVQPRSRNELIYLPWPTELCVCVCMCVGGCDCAFHVCLWITKDTRYPL